MAQRIQLRRLIGLALLLCLAFGGLVYRLVDLQVIHHDQLTEESRRMTQQQVLFEPRRGDILDIKGNLLATSQQVKTVCANPAFIGGYQAEVAHVLAPLLQENEAKLCQRLMPRTRRNEKGQTVTNQFVQLKARVKVDTWNQIQQAMTNLAFAVTETNLTRAQKSFFDTLRHKAVFARNDQLREYPNQALAAHVLGYAISEPREVDDQPVNDIIGQDGIEQAFDAQLAGVRGWRLTEADRLRRELVQWCSQDVVPKDGLNVVLTIDSVIQAYVESALTEGMEKHTPISITGIVIRPRTGEILAMATLPTYNPNDPGPAPLEARRNRVIADIAEPGSTFKIVVVSGALNEGIVRLTDPFDCEHGRFHFAGRPLGDHGSYGTLTVEQIITKSSNIGAAKIGIKLGEETLYSYIQKYGFGAPTGIPLPGEVSARRFVHPVRDWSKVSIAQIPMGQGISVTRLQMTMAMCAIANNGVLMRPMLVDRLEDRNHNVVAKYYPQRVREVIKPDAAKLMVTALKTVVTKDGTAPKAALEDYMVAGKTGTSQKVEHGTYVHDKHFSTFIGFFPADNPEVCIAVSMDEPKNGYFGGTAAAPVFKKIAERTAKYLCIPPDRLDETGVVDSASPAASESHPVKTAALRTKAQLTR